MHDVAAQAPSGLMDGLDSSGWIADKGYVGRGMITPHKKPPNGELSEAAKEANKSINKIRQVVERTIAHIKAWRIHPHRLPPPPAHIRADHHRRTLTPRLQNHPLNKLQDQQLAPERIQVLNLKNLRKQAAVMNNNRRNHRQHQNLARPAGRPRRTTGHLPHSHHSNLRTHVIYTS